MVLSGTFPLLFWLGHQFNSYQIPLWEWDWPSHMKFTPCHRPGSQEETVMEICVQEVYLRVSGDQHLQGAGGGGNEGSRTGLVELQCSPRKASADSPLVPELRWSCRVVPTEARRPGLYQSTWTNHGCTLPLGRGHDLGWGSSLQLRVISRETQWEWGPPSWGQTWAETMHPLKSWTQAAGLSTQQGPRGGRMYWRERYMLWLLPCSPGERLGCSSSSGWVMEAPLGPCIELEK